MLLCFNNGLLSLFLLLVIVVVVKQEGVNATPSTISVFFPRDETATAGRF